MNTYNLRPVLRRRNFVPLTAFSLLSLIAFFGFAASGAHPQDTSAPTSAQNEREFKIEIPEHLPIKVKLKSEKPFKDLKNKRWLREFEVEVKNTGTKPIYYLNFSLYLPDILVGGHPYGFGMQYGRRELFYPETAVEPGDVPIMPGESVTLKADEKTVKGYEHGRDVLKERNDPKRVVCHVQVIKFSDGTSLRGPDGELTREEPQGSSLNVPKQKNGAEGCRSSPTLRITNAPSDLLKVSNSWQPASFLRAYLLAPQHCRPRRTTVAAIVSPGVCGDMWGLPTALIAARTSRPGKPSFSPADVAMLGGVGAI